MSIEQGAGTNEPVTGGGVARVRATSAMARAVLPVEQPDGALVTAELPAITVRSTRGVAVSRYADPSRRRGGMIKRDPAPVALRIIVWSLFFVFLFTAAGVVVAKLHPDWVAFARNDVHTVVKTPPPPATPHSTRSTTHISVISRSPKQVNYSVPATSYSIVVVTVGRCWTVLHTPLNSPTPQFEAVVPATTTKTFAVNSSASLVTDAAVKSIRIMSGSRNLGAVAAPKIAVKYTFTAASTTPSS